MAEHEPRDASPKRTPPPRPTWWSRRRLRRLVGAAVLALGVPVLIGLLAQFRERDEWHWDDWAAVATSVWLGILFFILAIYVNRDADRRAAAVADAELLTTIGSLATSSARTFAGHDQQALRIAADARAALKHYPNANPDEQHALLRTIEDSYSDLAFGTLARADGLPRSIWDQLCAGAEHLGREAAERAQRMGRRATTQQLELAGMAAHVRFVQRIGAAVRVPAAVRHAGPDPAVRLLDGVWLDHPPDKESPSPLDQKQRLERLRCLYNRELTVLKDWDMLLDNAEHLTCCAELVEDLSLVDDWRAPWYLQPGDPAGGSAATPLVEVNVLDEPLDKEAAGEPLTGRGPFPGYPLSLRHGRLPRGLRSVAVDDLCDLLGRQSPVTVCVLVYDAVTEAGSTRLVLDGNHRLAAARRIFARWTSASPRPRRCPVRVLAFVIAEAEPVRESASRADVTKGQERFKPWRGFTPDIALLHGDDYPEAGPPGGR